MAGDGPLRLCVSEWVGSFTVSEEKIAVRRKEGGQATFWGTGDFRKRTLTVPGEIYLVCTGFWEYFRGLEVV